MPAVVSTPTAIDWPKANIDAPDATHKMALVHYEGGTGDLTVYDMRGYLTATYRIVTYELTGEVLRGTTNHVTSPNANDTQDLEGAIEVRPARGCSCHGYKRAPK